MILLALLGLRLPQVYAYPRRHFLDLLHAALVRHQHRVRHFHHHRVSEPVVSIYSVEDQG